MHKKLAFIGGVGSGKTTIIEKISSIDVVNTDVKSSIDIGKELTTVGIDYGHINLSDEISIGLYGVPGQSRFSVVWDFVSSGLWAAVLLIKQGDEDALISMQEQIDHFKLTSDSTCVIGITHTEDGKDADYISQVRHILQDRKLPFPIYQIDARKELDALLLMKTIVAIKETME